MATKSFFIYLFSFLHPLNAKKKSSFSKKRKKIYDIWHEVTIILLFSVSFFLNLFLCFASSSQHPFFFFFFMYEFLFEYTVQWSTSFLALTNFIRFNARSTFKIIIIWLFVIWRASIKIEMKQREEEKKLINIQPF